MVFSDESRFQLCPDDHQRLVCRRTGQRIDPSFTIDHHTGPQPRVMVQGAISFDSRTPARSPDLSTIEHVWDIVGRSLHLPGNVDDLARQLEHISQNIPQEATKALYHSMPR
ncbi:transposable element Tc1 transposase [Trichonephila clavipes]|nr:transposable element Tc1 transposase [Trichonephila clavipes]